MGSNGKELVSLLVKYLADILNVFHGTSHVATLGIANIESCALQRENKPANEDFRIYQASLKMFEEIVLMLVHIPSA